MTTIDQLSEAIGALRSDVRHLTQQMMDSNRRADEHRAAVHRRVDDLVEEVGALTTEVATMKGDVKDSKAVTDEVKQWKQRGIGALFVAGIAGTALGGTVVGFLVYWWEAILRLLRAS